MKVFISLLILVAFGGFWVYRVNQVVETSSHNEMADTNNSIMYPLNDMLESMGAKNESFWRFIDPETSEQSVSLLTLMSADDVKAYQSLLDATRADLDAVDLSSSPEAEPLRLAAKRVVDAYEKTLPDYEQLLTALVSVPGASDAASLEEMRSPLNYKKYKALLQDKLTDPQEVQKILDLLQKIIAAQDSAIERFDEAQAAFIQ